MLSSETENVIFEKTVINNDKEDLITTITEAGRPTLL